MKKHDEGYTLPLVMVVLLVLSLVAVTIMTTSLHNMQRQQKFIEQMQAQYEAQGKIEKLVAQLEAGQAVEIPFKNTATLDGNKLTGVIVVTSSDNTVTIQCGIELLGTEITATDGGFKISDMEPIKYTSYEIIKGGG